jgi:hypothetical protein
MKRATAASLKRVSAENLQRLGAERLADLLIDITAGRPELKRRLRMELAADQGAEHLAPEIDKRLTSLETSAGRISWRTRAAFLRDLEGLRALISERMAVLDKAAALERLWRFLATARRLADRVKRDDELDVVLSNAAQDIGSLLGKVSPAAAAQDLADAIASNPRGWITWTPLVLAGAPAKLAAETLPLLQERAGSVAGLIPHIRGLADAAGDVDAFMATYSANALRAPANAAEAARRLLAAGRVEDAGALLRAAEYGPSGLDFDWETVWIAYLDRAGQADKAQAARWSAFERTLSAERLRDFTKRLADFDDVEAEQRAFEYAARYPGFRTGLRLLMDWPALSEAAQMIETRADDVNVTVDEAEAWATKLRRRQPRAANILLRKTSAAAFRRRDFKTADRLTREADSLETL